MNVPSNFNQTKYLTDLAVHFKARGDHLSFNILRYLVTKHLNIIDHLGINVSQQDAQLALELSPSPPHQMSCCKVVIWGAGTAGYFAKHILELNGYKVMAFVDSNKTGHFCGLEIITPESRKAEYGKYPVIVSVQNEKSQQSIKNNLFGEDNGLPVYFINIGGRAFHLAPAPELAEYHMESGQKQYFSLPDLPHVENEVFLDCGSYNLSDSLEFANWCGGNYEKIYVFEPLPQSFNACKRQLEATGLSRVQLINAAVSDKAGIVRFFTNPCNAPGAKMSDCGDIDVQAVRIDDIVGNAKITFIKMDIEGAELDALKGARETIVRNRPKLAICIYHKGDDIYEIPNYIWELCPDYRLYLRHYSNSIEETVLYAI